MVPGHLKPERYSKQGSGYTVQNVDQLKVPLGERIFGIDQSVERDESS